MSESLTRFDVTSPEGRNNALDWFDKYGWVTGLIWLQWKVHKWCWNKIGSLTQSGAEQEIETQRRAAIDIIKAGKENGADELEITMSEEAGLGLGSSLKEFPIEIKAGTSGKMTLRVKYKS